MYQTREPNVRRTVKDLPWRSSELPVQASPQKTRGVPITSLASQESIDRASAPNADARPPVVASSSRDANAHLKEPI
jgi:hypothetical protein